MENGTEKKQLDLGASFVREEISIKDISTRAKEGKLLMAALAILTTSNYPDQTPDQVVQKLNKLSKEMFS